MREIRKSGSMRGNWKHALLARNGLPRQEEPRLGGAPVPYSTGRMPPSGSSLEFRVAVAGLQTVPLAGATLAGGAGAGGDRPELGRHRRPEIITR